MARVSNCSHVASMDLVMNFVDFAKDQCNWCELRGSNLWLCLYKDCHRAGCGDWGQDHSLLHYQKQTHHCVHLNLSTLRVWCYQCNIEVFQEPPSDPSPQRYPSTPSTANLDYADDDSDDCLSPSERDDNTKPMGLTGLQNIGNTCYMNAALQALSNTPPLTQYLLECGGVMAMVGAAGTGAAGESAATRRGLARAYYRLVQEMWHQRRPAYTAPTAILYSIRNVHPMFRGYHQHDTQEFLRCFMDQLHEELKVPYTPPPRPENTRQSFHVRRVSSLDELSEEEGEMEGTGGASSQSEGEEYETCDSGVSERSSLSDEGSTRQLEPHSRSPSPSSRAHVSVSVSMSPARNNHRGKKQQIKYRSIISDVFDGKLLSSVQCLTCNRISTRVETFQDLSLPIPSKDHLTMLHQGTVNTAKCAELYSSDQGWLAWLWEWVCSLFWGPTVGLHDCLSAFFSADELKGDNMYSCEKCNKLRNGVKYSKVLELPEVLCIHLKRFRHELMFSSKINNYVTFPLEDLDLKPYLHKDCHSQVTQYSLISVICHHGTAGSGGHYTSYCLNQQSSQWYEYDDQCVTLVRPDTVKNCEAYVLFYKKYSPEMDDQRDHVVQLSRTMGPVNEDSYVMSRAWFTRFLTFAEPGPIDNTDVLCRHNQLIPTFITPGHSNLLMLVPAPVWHYLYNIYGGGPTSSQDQLRPCNVCMQESCHRPAMQFAEFTRASQAPGQMFAVSSSWFTQWEAYVKGQSLGAPGPIDNTPLSTCDPALVQDVDYVTVTAQQWAFLIRLYQGGPEVMVQDSSAPPYSISLFTADCSNQITAVTKNDSITTMNSGAVESIVKEKLCLKIEREPLQKLKNIVKRKKKGKYRLVNRHSTLRKKGPGLVLKSCSQRAEMPAFLTQSLK